MEEYLDKKYQNMHMSRSTRQLSHTTCHMSWPSIIINSYSKIDFCFMPLFFFLFFSTPSFTTNLMVQYQNSESIFIGGNIEHQKYQKELTGSAHFAAMASDIFLLCSRDFGALLLPFGLGNVFLC